MADYYPVLKRAISALPLTSGEARRVVYDKARNALLKQLQSYTPPLSPAEITEQRMALEECIRRVESEVAGSAFGLSPEPLPPPPVETKAAPAVPSPTVAAPPPSVPPPSPPRVDPRLDAGRSALSQTLRQAENLGGAAAEAHRSARGVIEEEEAGGPSQPSEKIEPAFEAGPAAKRLAPEAPPPRVAAIGGETAPAVRRRRRSPWLSAFLILLLVLIVGGVVAYGERARLIAWWEDLQAMPAEPGTPVVDDGLPPKIPDRLPQEGDAATPAAPDARPVQTVAIDPPETESPMAAVAPDTAGAADTPPDSTAQAAVPENTPSPDSGAAATPTTPAVETPPDAAALPRVFLYEEAFQGASGSRLSGQVDWSFVSAPVASGQEPVPQLRAVIDVPERGLKATLSIRHNPDKTLPASHFVEVKFEPASGTEAIDTVAGLILKETESAPGKVLKGALAKITSNLFWIDLSGLETERQENITLLKERSWIDVPIRYNNGRRGILSFEKGASGNAAFASAFAAWQQ